MIATTLPSGLKVVTVEMPNFYTVSAGLFVKAGSRLERQEQMGISHFIEHLLFKGSAKYSAKEISEIIEGKGGVLNAYTAEESSCFYFKTLPQSFFESLDVLVDLFTQPLFDRNEVEKERDVVIEELHSYEDQPNAYIEDLFGSVIWHGHPLGNMILGTKENVARHSVDDLYEFFRQYYTAPNTVLAVAGCISHQAVLDWVVHEEHRFLSGTPNAFTPFVQQQYGPRVNILYKEIEQCNLQMGVPCPGKFSDQQWAIRLLSTLVGENMSSRLFQEIRENRGLAYHISSSVDFFDEVGMLSIQSGVEVDKVEICVKESLQVLKELTTTEVSHEELERAKTFAVGQALQDMESTLSCLLWVGEKVLFDEKDVMTSHFCEKIQRVTSKEVLEVAHEIFNTSKLNLALIGPYHNGNLVNYLKF